MLLYSLDSLPYHLKLSRGYEYYRVGGGGAFHSLDITNMNLEILQSFRNFINSNLSKLHSWKIWIWTETNGHWGNRTKILLRNKQICRNYLFSTSYPKYLWHNDDQRMRFSWANIPSTYWSNFLLLLRLVATRVISISLKYFEVRQKSLGYFGPDTCWSSMLWILVPIFCHLKEI